MLQLRACLAVFWPPSINWVKIDQVSIGSNKMRASAVYLFKPCHTKYYIGQFYKSGFGSLLVLLAEQLLPSPWFL
jgi:hypothetical protein